MSIFVRLYGKGRRAAQDRGHEKEQEDAQSRCHWCEDGEHCPTADTLGLAWNVEWREGVTVATAPA